MARSATSRCASWVSSRASRIAPRIWWICRKTASAPKIYLDVRVVYLPLAAKCGCGEQLYDALVKHQLKPWLDSRELDTGADWNRQVAAAIRSADAIVFLIGPPGPEDRFQRFESEQVLDEETYLDPSKALVPVVIGDADVPGFLRPRRLIKISPASIDFELLADQIAGAIQYTREYRRFRTTRTWPPSA